MAKTGQFLLVPPHKKVKNYKKIVYIMKKKKNKGLYHFALTFCLIISE